MQVLSQEEGSYPKVWFFSLISSVSSGAQLLLPQMAGPPTGSMPMPAPQVRKSAARRRAGTSFLPQKGAHQAQVRGVPGFPCAGDWRPEL